MNAKDILNFIISIIIVMHLTMECQRCIEAYQKFDFKTFLFINN
jgi:hypothetical protein